MTKNPYLNALLAVVYIVLVAVLLTYGTVFVRNKPDTILAPIAMLSLLVLSASFMGYTFFFQPVLMYLEGKKHEAVTFFIKTLGAFAVATGLIVLVALTV